MLSQIPPQYIYAGPGCEAALPDYTPKVHATDNCVLVSILQTPAPGFLLNSAQMIQNVVIKATDKSGNSSQINFNVILLDTIPPVITVDTSLYTDGYNLINALYNQADRILADKLNIFDATFPYSKLGLPVADSSWYKDYMVVVSAPPDSTGLRERVFSFWNESDSTTVIP